MQKWLFSALLSVFCLTSWSQNTGVEGRLVDSNSSNPVANAQLTLSGNSLTVTSDTSGRFKFPSKSIQTGEQTLFIEAAGYKSQQLAVIVQSGRLLNLDPILLEIDLAAVEAQIGIISLSDNELNQDEGTAYSISGLLQASNDVFLNAAAFDFSATFFRPRGLDNANGKVLINGIEMNKQFNGRPQWANWGGLNDAQRNREVSRGSQWSANSFGDLAGTTNIIMRASQYREGGRVSYAAANRSYEGRVMASYNSGLTASGWAYSILASRRFGTEGYIEGTPYDANSLFFSVEKKLNASHSLNLTAFYTPNTRGRSTAITQEVRDLKSRRYNPNWGFQEGTLRNSRMRNTEEPVVMLNHYWKLGQTTEINTNIAYQTGAISNTRIDNGGTRLVQFNGEEAYLGGARNPSPNYYQRLPSFFLQDPFPTALDYQNAYLAQQEFQNNGQFDWAALYEANRVLRDAGGNSVYVVQDDRVEDTQITANTFFSTQITEAIRLNAGLNYRRLISDNFAEVNDLLGGTGYLDVDFFAEDDVNTIIEDAAQSDLRNRNRIVTEGDRYKYNYELTANVASAYVQTQVKTTKIDFYIGASASNTQYQRNGLYENGNFPGSRSFGESEQLSFSNFGGKAGFTYKITGRHLIDANAMYFTKAPTLRNTFANARQTNDVIVGLTSETWRGGDLSYIYRSPIVKGRLTGFYNEGLDQTEVNFFFTQSAQGFQDGSAFVQEVLTGMDTRRMGVELGLEAQVTPTIKLKAAASVGEYVYTNNPQQYLTGDDFQGLEGNILRFGDGTSKLKNYHVAGGPEQAYQIGFEYRDPDFWWVGTTTNYFSHAFIDPSSLRRSDAFALDSDGLPFNDYDPLLAQTLLQQEQLDSYFLVNIVGGKSWKIKDYFVGFFATINNVLDQEYKTGGFEDSRIADFRQLREEQARQTPLFGNRYFFGFGTTYYLNVYLRF